MATIYVATNGTASGAGSVSAPLRTIAQAMAKAVAGDTVLVKDGTYSEPMIQVKAGVTLKAANRLGAKLRPTSYVYAIVNLSNGSTIDGFDLGSDRPVVNGQKSDSLHSHGIFTNGGRKIAALNNRCFGGGESGIGLMKFDFATIEGNEVFGNGWMTWGSGISLYEPEANGEATPAGTFRNVIRNNISHHNFQDGGPFTDGNGIIIDDFQHWQNDPKVEYNLGFLVENNLCYQNGGKGIAVHWSNAGVMRRNTVIGNNRDNKNTTTWRGDLSQQDCSGNRWEGNLAIPDVAVNGANTGFGYYGNNSSTQWVGNATTDARANLGGSGTLPGTGNLFNVVPAMVDFVPTNPALANIGWRPSGVTPTPVPEPEPVPEHEPLPAAPNDLSPFALLAPTGIIANEPAYELGTKFTTDKPGKIIALRLYRTNATPQAIRLWKGSVVAAAGSIPGGADGWTEIACDVAAAAGDAFTVSVSKSAAQRYAADNALSAPVKGDGFTIPAKGGVFANTAGQLPSQVYQSSYYWVDVRFAETAVAPTPEPDMEARIAALEAQQAATQAQVAAMSAEYGPRILALEAAVLELDEWPVSTNELAALAAEMNAKIAGVLDELVRLDARLDAISGAAGD